MESKWDQWEQQIKGPFSHHYRDDLLQQIETDKMGRLSNSFPHSSGKPTEEEVERLEEPERMETPGGRGPLNQLSERLMGTQDWRSKHRAYIVLHLCIDHSLQLSILWDSRACEWVSLVLKPALGTLSSAGLPCPVLFDSFCFTSYFILSYLIVVS